MNEYYSKVKVLDEYTGIEDTFICMVIFIIVILGCFWYDSSSKNVDTETVEVEEEEAEPPRNFTYKQLQYFDGTKDPKTDEEKPIYLSVHGRVFNVTSGKDFYGPGSPYENFAGHECGVAFAKFSFDTEYLDDVDGCDNKLNWFEKEELYNWIEKFSYYRNYPEVGRLVPNDLLPKSDCIISKEELAMNNGVSLSTTTETTSNDEKTDENTNDGDANENTTTATTTNDVKKQEETNNNLPRGYATAPIYVALKDKVFDASFGGVTMYGPGGPYHKFAGKDVSRALAKMSFAPEDLDNTDISDLTEKQIKVLDDWIKTYEEKKMYPIIGRLEK